jgi:hypothetical protein
LAKELDSALQAICLCLSLMNTVAYLTRDDVPLFFYFDDIVDTNKENHETIAIKNHKTIWLVNYSGFKGLKLFETKMKLI